MTFVKCQTPSELHINCQVKITTKFLSLSSNWIVLFDIDPNSFTKTSQSTNGTLLLLLQKASLHHSSYNSIEDLNLSCQFFKFFVINSPLFRSFNYQWENCGHRRRLYQFVNPYGHNEISMYQNINKSPQKYFLVDSGMFHITNETGEEFPLSIYNVTNVPSKKCIYTSLRIFVIRCRM